MKCTACGENNVDNARFCAFCGAKLDTTRDLPVVEPANEAKATEKPASEPAKETAPPLREHPNQPVPRARPGRGGGGPHRALPPGAGGPLPRRAGGCLPGSLLGL